jgi:hypothetical protein
MRRRRWGSLRTAMAALLAFSSLGVFAAFGGVGVGAALAEYEYGKKVTICHKGKNMIVVSGSTLESHLAHGDTLGPCPP